MAASDYWGNRYWTFRYWSNYWGPISQANTPVVVIEGSMVSFGFVTVTTAGVPVRLTANEGDPTARNVVHSYFVEVHSNNTGNIYVGSSTMNKSTGVGVYAILAPPKRNLYLAYNADIVKAANSFDLSVIYLDADVSGEKALVSALVV